MKKNIVYTDLSSKNLSPVIKSSYLFCPDPEIYKRKILEDRQVNNYEIELILESNGSMIIDDKNYKIKENDIIFRKPGQTTQGILPYKCYAIIFEMTNKKNSDLTQYKNEIIDKIPQMFTTKYPNRYIPFFDTILKEYINPTSASAILFKINILQILYLMHLEINSPYLENSITNSGYHTSLKKALEYVNNNWNKSFSIDDIAKHSNLSKNHFIKIFTKSIGKTPNNYLTDYRIQKAKELLAMTNLSIIEVSLKCGYDNIPYFSFLFKKKTSTSPSEFRKIHTYI
ncbi:MAG: AraC family transcriptional regulator [Clostridiales bacterium]